ncbi:hypothetical protein [Viridibacillus arvi]|uniref:hypothetical protein n=1 Tax=Viridibacillus arvi TaxID=263475 RepID=UPI0036EA0F0F
MEKISVELLEFKNARTILITDKPFELADWSLNGKEKDQFFLFTVEYFRRRNDGK